jgi:hypothetical protein
MATNNNRKLFLMLAVSVCAMVFGQNATENTEKQYAIGDLGPAGGIVFYDKGNDKDGWRYLEAAPAETEAQCEWGLSGVYIYTRPYLGRGAENTETIIQNLKIYGGKNRAAQYCAALETGSVTDWYLPSKDELNILYKNLKKAGLGGFKDTWYWSSSLLDEEFAWSQLFKSGQQYNANKKSELYTVRAIRSFK